MDRELLLPGCCLTIWASTEPLFTSSSPAKVPFSKLDMVSKATRKRGMSEKLQLEFWTSGGTLSDLNMLHEWQICIYDKSTLKHDMPCYGNIETSRSCLLLGPRLITLVPFRGIGSNVVVIGEYYVLGRTPGKRHTLC